MGAREWVLRLDQLKNSMSRLTPSTVKESFSLSGLFGEASLLSSKKNMKPDLKQVLRGLLRAIPNGSQISKNIEQAVLEIEGRQVESLSNQNSRECPFNSLCLFRMPIQCRLDFIVNRM